MKELKELQNKYRELGEEIEALKGGYPFYYFSKDADVVHQFIVTSNIVANNVIKHR